jgi:hypothetical protein
MRKGSKHAHKSEIFSLCVVARCSVGDLKTKTHERAKVTQILMTCGATWAAATRWDEAKHHMVAWGQPADAFAHLFNNAGTFVATNDGKSERKVTRCEVLIRVAHARCGNFDQYFTWARCIEFDFFDTPRSIYFPENGCLGLH